MRPESMTTVWPVMVSVRHMATTMSAQSSLSAAFFRSEPDAERSICSDRRLAVASALQQTRRHAVDERLRRQRHRHATRQMNEPRLRHGIGDRRAGWAKPCYRSYVDDAASPLGLHDRGYRLGQAHWPRQVDGHDLVPYLQRQIVEIAEGDRDVVSGVID